MADMQLKIRLPTRPVADLTVRKINVETSAGALCLLPRHIDVVANLVPGMLSYVAADADDSRETYVAVDGGALVKCGSEVFVSAPAAIPGGDLDNVEHAVETAFRERHERERRARAAIEKMEADVVRRFVEAERYE